MMKELRNTTHRILHSLPQAQHRQRSIRPSVSTHYKYEENDNNILDINSDNFDLRK